METSKFDSLVDSRARQRVEEKIRNFRKVLARELANIDQEINLSWSNFWESKKVVELLQAIVSIDLYKKETWPQRLLEQEKTKVSQELISTMDEMQKAFLSVQSFVPQIDFSKDK